MEIEDSEKDDEFGEIVGRYFIFSFQKSHLLFCFL